MEIIPAIDIKDGVCVRLLRGDFAQATVYGNDPIEIARRWVAQGATRLHVVDLDGARAGHPVNTATIMEIVRVAGVPVQLGGGLRAEEQVEAALASGASYAILGTAAVQEPALVERMVKRFGDNIIVSVDARDGWVATTGWTELSHIRATDLIDGMASLGVKGIIYTDISRDGTLTEPNYAATGALVRPGGPAILASGGITHIDHLQRLAALGIAGAIVGRALYTEHITLPAALEALRRRDTA